MVVATLVADKGLIERLRAMVREIEERSPEPKWETFGVVEKPTTKRAGPFLILRLNGSR